MKKNICLLLVLLIVIQFAGCATDTHDTLEEADSTGQSAEYAAESPEPPQREVTLPDPDEPEDDPPYNPLAGSFNLVAFAVTSEPMQDFEAEHAVTEEQERYLAFGSFVLTNNFESVRVFALNSSSSNAARLLRDYWGVTDRQSAIDQLMPLAQANGQSPAADDIFNTFVRNGHLDPLHPLELIYAEADSGFIIIPGIENVYDSTVSRASRMTDEFEHFMESSEIPEEDRDEAFEVFVILLLTERINRGLGAYVDAKNMLIRLFGYTEEELLSIETLAAWDYGRVAIVARYGVAAGYIDEDTAWEYLALAASNASHVYSSWREYTAAHIMGRALAFGNNSRDFVNTLDFLLNYDESPFQRIAFD